MHINQKNINHEKNKRHGEKETSKINYQSF